MEELTYCIEVVTHCFKIKVCWFLKHFQISVIFSVFQVFCRKFVNFGSKESTITLTGKAHHKWTKQYKHRPLLLSVYVSKKRVWTKQHKPLQKGHCEKSIDGVSNMLRITLSHTHNSTRKQEEDSHEDLPSIASKEPISPHNVHPILPTWIILK